MANTENVLALERPHPMAWTGGADELEDSPVVHMDKEDVAEVEKVLETFNMHDVGFDGLTRKRFELPTGLKERLEAVAREVHEGRGYSIVRGFDREYEDVEHAAIFLAIANYIGEQRGVQDPKGSILMHVTSVRDWTVPDKQRHGIHTTTELPWHSDMGAEVLALHVRDLSESGGDTLIASSWTIYKELEASHPDDLKVLLERNWPVQVSGETGKDVDYTSTALLHIVGDKVLISVDPGRLGLHTATAQAGADSDALQLTEKQTEALKVLNELATKHSRRLDLQKGDMVFINNLSLLHERESYKDPEDGPGRHLVRLWLRNKPLAWEVPCDLWPIWESAFGPNGDGFPNRKTEYAISPPKVYKPSKYTAGSAAFILEDGQDVNDAGSKEKKD